MPQTSLNNLLDQTQLAAVLHQFGENQSGWFIVMDREHRLHFVNERFAESVGKPRDAIIGLKVTDIGLPDAIVHGCVESGVPGLHMLNEKCMATGDSMRSVDNTFVPDESELDSNFMIRTPIFDKSRAITGLIVQSLDHSAVRCLETEIQYANETAYNLSGKLSTLDKVLSDLLVCHDRTELLQKITDTVVSQTLAIGAYITTLDESGDFMTLIASSGFATSNTLGNVYQIGEGLIGKAWEAREIIFTDDAVACGATYQYKVKTQLCALPVYDGDRIVAVMSAILHGQEKSVSLKDDVPTLKRVANLAGIALSNERLLNTTRTALQQSHALAEVSHRLVAVDSLDEACKLVCEAMVPVLSICTATTLLINDNGEFGSIFSFDSHRTDGSQATAEHSPEVQLSAQRCISTKQLTTISTAECLAIKNGIEYVPSSHPIRPEKKENAFHIASVPVLKNGSIRGVLTIGRAIDLPSIDYAVLDILRTLAAQLGTILQRQELTYALHHQAFHDRLTGMPNRHRFEAELNALLEQNEPGALLFIDLDGFKDVNDTHGHAIGDQLLHQVAARLCSHITPSDVVSRVGGDEFAVILRSSIRNNAELAIGQAMLDALAKPFQIDNASIAIGASIGVSRFPEDGNCVDALLRNADLAMYQAKQNGKGCLLTFDADLAEELRRLGQLQSDLTKALDENQLELHYQPQVSCNDGRVLCVEALLRWRHPEKGYISPGEFIPAAEQSNLINDLGKWVVDRAIAQIAAWRNTRLGNVRVSINIAATQFQEEGFARLILKTLEHHGAPTHLLELEVTESVVMRDLEAVVQRLHTLRNNGIRIAVDDFGTGYSSLSYLQDLPLDVLKIDKSFVSRLQNESSDNSVARTITLLAKGLGLETVAEGVETAGQHDAIVKMGCHSIQGFFYSKAVPADELLLVIEELQNTGNELKKAA